MDINTLYQGLILDASFRGISFTMLDSRDEAGRRALRFLFPDRDDSVFQDLGVLDGPIRITGLLIGDDYVHQAERMRQAFRGPGPGTLVHPWLGELQAVVGDPLPNISFSQKELRVARFDATFWPRFPRDAQAPDFLTALGDAISDIRAQARAALARLLAPAVATLAAISYVERFCAGLATTFTGLISGGFSDPGIVGSTNSLIAALALPGVAAAAGDGGAVYDLIAAVPGAVSDAAAPAGASAIGAGPATSAATPADPRVATGLLLAAAASVTSAADPVPGPALAAATQAACVAAALETIQDIEFTSDQDARAWLARALTALDAARQTAASLGATQPATAGFLWNSLTDSRARLLSAMNAQIGALPSVATLALAASVPAWIVAQYLSGDDPSSVVATYQDIVARNLIRNPAIVAAGAIEVLSPSVSST